MRCKGHKLHADLGGLVGVEHTQGLLHLTSTSGKLPSIVLHAAFQVLLALELCG